jgi:drug/metabolite transporter (DMT)-like permease
MLHTRYGTWHSPAIQLVPWQLLIASVLVIIVCFLVNPHPVINMTPRLVEMGLYNGIFATGFAYAGIIYVSQRLSVITTSLLLLMVPVLGLIFSSLMLGEKLTFEIMLALIFIVLGLIFISIDNRNTTS